MTLRAFLSPYFGALPNGISKTCPCVSQCLLYSLANLEFSSLLNSTRSLWLLEATASCTWSGIWHRENTFIPYFFATMQYIVKYTR